MTDTTPDGDAHENHGRNHELTVEARATFHAALKRALSAAQPVALEAIQWPTMPPSKGQSPVLFEDGYAEGWAKCLDACKAALAASHPSRFTEPPPNRWR